jgi:hypothetical protein
MADSQIETENTLLLLRAERRLGRRINFILGLFVEISANTLFWYIWANGPANRFPWPLPFSIFAVINILTQLSAIVGESKQFDDLSQRLIERQVAELQKEYESTPRLLEKLDQLGFHKVRTLVVEHMKWRQKIYSTFGSILYLSILGLALTDRTLMNSINTFPMTQIIEWAIRLPLLTCGSVFVLFIVATVILGLMSPTSLPNEYAETVVLQQERVIRKELQRQMNLHEDRIPLWYRINRLFDPIRREINHIRVWLSMYNEVGPEKAKSKRVPTVQLTDDGELIPDDQQNRAESEISG